MLDSQGRMISVSGRGAENIASLNPRKALTGKTCIHQN
jgi:hypothetical protein